MKCEQCGTEFEARKSGRPQRTCPGGKCYEALRSEERHLGRVVRSRARSKVHARHADFEEERYKPEFQAKVAEILAWAEAQHPATPEAWGLEVKEREAQIRAAA